MNIQHFHGVPPLYTNTFLIITNAKHGIIIDAAAEPETYLKALDEAGATLTHILLTHGHFDHVLGVPDLLAVYPDLPVYITETDYPEARDGGQFGYKMGPVATKRITRI